MSAPDQTDDGRNAWGCDHHPEWADDANRCHHPAHDQQARERRCICRCDAEAGGGFHLDPGCPVHGTGEPS